MDSTSRFEFEFEVKFGVNRLECSESGEGDHGLHVHRPVDFGVEHCSTDIHGVVG